MHNLLLRYWLAAAGIDPDKDVHLETIPPAQMVADLKTGSIDGYCVGEPWNLGRHGGYRLHRRYRLRNLAGPPG
jgi:ABC-type nitrate/sulfonate/bicarbonate transport system substrate-binding protein